MKTHIILRLIAPLVGIIYFPLLCGYLFSRKRKLIDSDVERWKAHQPHIYNRIGNNTVLSYLTTLLLRPEFRKQAIWRMGGGKRLAFNLLYESCNSLYIENPAQIGEGLMVIHGAGTVIGGGCVIGKIFTIYQNATIGFNEGFSRIGDNVYVGAGAIVIGAITIGNNVKIGAGAIVVTDVPDDSTVVGPKARVITHPQNRLK